MPAPDITFRPFARPDVPQLHALMRALAEFEGYTLAVTPDDIVQRGLGQHPQFEALVAHREGSDMLLGMAVTYQIPYTYSLKPTMVLKELYVAEEARGDGIGEALFNAVKAKAAACNCGQLIWTVVPWNEKAKRFYAKLGGRPEDQWQSWVCDAL